MAFSLSRNANLFISTVDKDTAKWYENTWEVKVLDGFSFSSATSTQEIEINEAGDTPSRGQQVFTTAIEPAEWSFQAYVRPRYDTLDDTNDAVERVLWEGLAGADAAGIATASDGTATTLQNNTTGGMTVDFLASNTNELKLLYFYWNLGTVASPVWYYMPGAVVNQAEVDFSIDAIASIAWSGFANAVEQITSAETTEFGFLTSMLANPADLQDSAFPVSSTAGYLQSPTGQQACIRNKLSTVSLVPESGQGNLNVAGYDVALTGGTLTINNNITFLTPEALGVVNQPCGHFTGTLAVSGNMTAYLKTGDAQDTASLMDDLLDYSTGATASSDPTKFALTMYIGGAISDLATPWLKPILQVNMPDAHLVIPTINIEDVVSVDIPFTALPYDTAGDPDPTSGSQIDLAYFAAE